VKKKFFGAARGVPGDRKLLAWAVLLPALRTKARKLRLSCSVRSSSGESEAKTKWGACATKVEQKRCALAQMGQSSSRLNEPKEPGEDEEKRRVVEKLRERQQDS
jgi:hypothetical protein